jgi:hypothetical protein
MVVCIFLTSGCAAEKTQNSTNNRYHELYFDDPEAQVWVDARFELLVALELKGSKVWLYSDYEGQPDQEFILVFSGANEDVDWPPTINEQVSKISSPIGTVYESYGGVEFSQLYISELGKSYDFSHPACGFSRVWDHKSNSGRYLSLMYVEGALCVLAFGPKSDLGEMFLKTRASAVIKLKAK